MKQNKHNGTREGERKIVANKAATAVAAAPCLL
jgi:hypothetical protein